MVACSSPSSEQAWLVRICTASSSSRSNGTLALASFENEDGNDIEPWLCVDPGRQTQDLRPGVEIFKALVPVRRANEDSVES